MNKTVTEEEIKAIAAQLRKPEGELGTQVAQVMNVGNQPMNLHTLAVLNPQPLDHILEIGMGNGYFVKNILRLDDSIKYTGCDYSELMVHESVQNNREFVENGRAKFLWANINQLPFENAEFNKIFTINTFYFWDNIAIVLAELKRVLIPNGELIISIRPKHNLEKNPINKYGFAVYETDDILKMLSDNGFNPVEITKIIEPPQERMGMMMDRESVMIKCISV